MTSRECKEERTKKHRKGTKKLFRSGELAEILGVTIMSVSNFRREGMPYVKETNVGYLYSFLAIKWFIMFKTQSIHDNKHYKRCRESIDNLQMLNSYYQEEVKDPQTTAEQRAYLVHMQNENVETIKKIYRNL